MSELLFLATAQLPLLSIPRFLVLSPLSLPLINLFACVSISPYRLTTLDIPSYCLRLFCFLLSYPLRSTLGSLANRIIAGFRPRPQTQNEKKVGKSQLCNPSSCNISWSQCLPLSHSDALSDHSTSSNPSVDLIGMPGGAEQDGGSGSTNDGSTSGIHLGVSQSHRSLVGSSPHATRTAERPCWTSKEL